MAILAIFVVSIAVSASAAEKATWKGDEPLKQYAYYSELIVPSRQCSLGETEYEVESIVTFPSGKQSTFDKVLLDETGEYTVVYTANADNTAVESQSFKFDVKASPADLWNTNLMIEATNSANVPEYEGNGAVLLSANERGEARYVNPVYLGDNKDGDDLMTFVVAPKNIGQAEFGAFDIVVEDYQNPENRVYIRLSRGVHDVAGEKHNINVSVSTDGKTFLGKDGKQYDFKTDSIANAYILTGSGFYGELSDGTTPTPVKVSINIRKKTVTVACSNSFTFNLADEGVVGSGNAWEGIDSGLAYVYAGFLERLSSSAASVAIYTIDGISMGGNTITSKAPMIVVDDSEFGGKVVAKEGVKHSFLDAIAVDSVCGMLETNTVVYKVKDDIIERVSSYYDGFIPAEAGKYYVEYISAPNVDGIKGTGGYYVDVLKAEDCDISFNFGSLINSVKAGETITIPDHTVSGGIGKVKVTYSAKIGSNIVKIEEGRMIPEHTGELILTALCKDLVQTTTFSESVTVNANDEIYFDLGYIPDTILVGDAINLTKASVYKYTANGKENLDMSITFDGSKVSGGKIVPTSAQEGEKQIVISAGGVEKKYTVKVKVVGTKSGMTADYFSISSGEVTASGSMVQAVTSQDSKIEFLRDIDQSFFNIRFVALPETANFTHLTFTLHDTMDASNSVTFDVLNSTDTSLGDSSEIVYAGQKHKIYGSFRDRFGYNKFVIKYDESTKSILDNKGDSVFTLTECADGKSFNGFKGNIRITVDVCGVTAESKINFYNIGEQELKKSVTAKNNNGPQVVFIGSFAVGETGKEYKIPEFKAYDVLDNVASILLSVTDPSKKEIYKSSDIVAFKFTPAIGGEYTVTLTFKDDKGNETVSNNKINVTTAGSVDFVVGGVNVPLGETTAPTVNIGSKPTEVAKVGEAFEIAKITVSDNKTAEKDLKIYAYVIDPNGVRTILCSTPVKVNMGDALSAEEKLAMFTASDAEHISCTALKTGKHVIYYIVRDADGLTSMVRYNVEVVANNG